MINEATRKKLSDLGATAVSCDAVMAERKSRNDGVFCYYREMVVESWVVHVQFGDVVITANGKTPDAAARNAITEYRKAKS